MAHGIGVLITERIAVGAISDHELSGELCGLIRKTSRSPIAFYGLPADNDRSNHRRTDQATQSAKSPSYIGVGMPGIVRNGIVEDSPNLVQFKGVNVQALITEACTRLFGKVPVAIFNDADVMAAGIAAKRGHLDRLIRVWTLGNGIGFGQYPYSMAFGRRDTRLSVWIQKSSSAAAAARDIWKGSWASAPCGFALWTGSPRKSFSMRNAGTPVAWTS